MNHQELKSLIDVTKKLEENIDDFNHMIIYITFFHIKAERGSNFFHLTYLDLLILWS